MGNRVLWLFCLKVFMALATLNIALVLGAGLSLEKCYCSRIYSHYNELGDPEDFNKICWWLCFMNLLCYWTANDFIVDMWPLIAFSCLLTWKEQGHKLFCKIDPHQVRTNGQATDGRLGLLRPLIIINLGLVQARWGRELPEKHQIQGLTTIRGADHLVANKWTRVMAFPASQASDMLDPPPPFVLCS